MRRWKCIVGLFSLAALLSVGGCVAGFVALDRYLDPFDDRPFSQAAWAAADEEGRGLMARDAIRHIPAGTSKDRVRELLGDGEPPWLDPRGSVDRFGVRLDHPETWVYWLGCWSGLGPYRFDSAFLYVHFGPDGRVAMAEVNGG